MSLCRSSRNYNREKSQGDRVGSNIHLWRLRNDSSGVSAALRQDHVCISLKRATASVPNMISSGKLTLMSKKSRERCSRIAIRKPVKGCYCNEANKTHLRSSRTHRKPASPCRQCKSQIELRSIREIDDKASLVSPISCETFRRVRKIDYTPRSQFLRNVQSKICELQTGGQGDCSPACPRSSSYHKLMASARIQALDEKTILSDECERADERTRRSPAIPRAPANSMASDQNESDRDNAVCVSCKRATQRASSRERSKLRKTLSSRKQVSDKRPSSTSPTRGKRVAQPYKRDYQCCRRNRLDKQVAGGKWEGKRDLLEYHGPGGRCPRHDGPEIDDSDQELRNLRKFRDQNYFETHGSSHTLASSGSSGSLQQYLLNERLFPEAVGKIHKRDLVVTMPPCATTQRKRIHYFPRHVVQQERNVCNTNYRRKRCQSCPLTGHAIDLGVLKTRPPLNSLALKYQKKAP